MSAFTPRPTFMQMSPSEYMLGAASYGGNAGEAIDANVRSGFMGSFGIGTVLRTLLAPPPLTRNRARGETDEAYRRRMEAYDRRVLSEEEYKALPSYREAIPWEKGMTAERSAALATWYDERQQAGWLASHHPIAGFVGQFGGALLDPANYIPVFGPVARAAVVAKAGFFGHVALGAAEASVNTAVLGIATASIREKYGDEISFQSIVDEIATSALVGGLFGAGIGAWAAGRNVRVKKAVQQAQQGIANIATKAKAADLLRRGADDVINKGYVDFEKSETAPISETAAEVVRRTEGEAALRAETDGITLASEEYGIVTPEGDFSVSARPRVVEASDLTYTARSPADERAISKIAADIDPQRLNVAFDTVDGAPVVGRDGVVDAGNRRVGAINQMYETNPAKAAEYRKMMEDRGFDLTGFQRPVLVMERTTDLSPRAREAFRDHSNPETPTSATGEAFDDVIALDDVTLRELQPGAATSPENAAYVSRFIRSLHRGQRSAFTDFDGNLTETGARRIENATVTVAYGNRDPGAVRRFVLQDTQVSRSVTGALMDNAARYRQLQRLIDLGEVDPAFDPGKMITQALDAVGKWSAIAARENRPLAEVIKDGIGQMRSLQTEDGIAASRLIEAMFTDDSFSTPLAREPLKVLFANIIDNAERLGTPSLFDRPGVSINEVLSHVSASEQADYRIPSSALGIVQPVGSADRATPIFPAGEENAARSRYALAQADAAQAPADTYIGGLSIQQSLETQGRDFIPSDADMAQLEARLEHAARWGGADASIKMLSTEGRYGGVERSVDIEVRGAGYEPEYLWRAMVREAEKANQDSVFLAREVGDDFDPIKHRPALEITYDREIPRESLDALDEFYTVIVNGRPRAPGAMAPAHGMRTFVLPEFERRYDFADKDLTTLDDKALGDYMLARADDLYDIAARISEKLPGAKIRVAWYDTKVAFRSEYGSILNEDVGRIEAAGRPAGEAAWQGQSVREGLAAADRQLQWLETRAATGRLDQVNPDPVVQPAQQWQASGDRVQVSSTGMRGKTTVKDVAKAFTDDHNAKVGRKLYPEKNPEDYELVRRMALDDFAKQIEQPNSGVGWYSKDVQEALDLTQRAFPTLKDPVHRDLYLTFAGIFSNGNTPESAWALSAEAYRSFLRTGKVPLVRDGGKKWSIRDKLNTQHLQFLNHLVKELGSVERALGWLTDLHRPADIDAMMKRSGFKAGRFNTKKAYAGPDAYGAMALGEKLGRYTLSLRGIELEAKDAVVDMWYTRTYRRWTGRLFDGPIDDSTGIVGGVGNESERAAVFRLTEAVHERYPELTAGDVQAVLWFYEKRLYAEHGVPTNEGTNAKGARKLLASLGVDDGLAGGGEGGARGKDGEGRQALQPQIAQQQQAFAGISAANADSDSFTLALDMHDMTGTTPMSRSEIDAYYAPQIEAARLAGDTERLEWLERRKAVQSRFTEKPPTRDDIYRETGWFQGVDGGWRFEINDAGAAIQIDKFIALDDPSFPAEQRFMLIARGVSVSPESRFYFGNLGDVLGHDKLYAAYPDIRRIKVRLAINPEGPKYQGYWDGEGISLQANDAANLRSSLMHEIQHVIQDAEGFASGGYPGMGEVWEGPAVEQALQTVKSWEDKLANGTPAEREEAAIYLPRAKSWAKRQAEFEYYQRLAGETEARNVQERLNLGNEFFLKRFHNGETPAPWMTMDRPEGVQIVITNSPGGEAYRAITERLPDKIEEGDRLPFALDRYFTKPEGYVDVPIEQLTPIRAREKGIRNAAKFMRDAYNGTMAPRGPISLKQIGPDRYEVRDGNSTYANAVANGWPAIRAEVLTDAEFAARVMIKEAKKKATEMLPKVGEPGTVVALDDVPDLARSHYSKAWLEMSPHDTLDSAYAVAQKWQDDLNDTSAAIRQQLGLPPAAKRTAIKLRATAEGKIKRKGYRSTKQITDIVRDGIAVETPAQADEVLKLLGQKYNVLDEGWNVTPLGYFDRKLLLQFPDGTVGEMQLYHPEMLRVKTEVGHKLFEEWRNPDTAPERKAELVEEQLAVYGSALRTAAPEWRELINELTQVAEGMSGREPNMAANSAAVRERPLSITSPASTSVQPSPGARIANADAPLESTTAGRPSQSKNQTSIPDDVGQLSLDLKPYSEQIDIVKGEDPMPPVEPIDDATLTKSEDIKEMYDRFGLKEDGSFDELDDIKQMREEGRLDPEDEMEMDASERDLKNAEAYGKVLKAAVACIT